MVVAKKKYYYDNYNVQEYYKTEDKNKTKKTNKKKRNRSSLYIKISLMICVVFISASLIFILSRYTAVSEAKYNINALNKEADELRVELQDLKAELESLTRSDIIEKKAIERLSMQYPKYEQMVFLTSVDKYTLDSPNSEDNIALEKQNQDKNVYEYIKSFIPKLYSLID